MEMQEDQIILPNGMLRRKKYSWKIEIPGKGKSSPVVWDDKIFITGAAGIICEVYCIDKNSGKILWTGTASDIPGEPSELPKTDPEAGLAVSTVTTNGKIVCAVFANGNLVCFDMDGKKNGQRILVFLKAAMVILLRCLYIITFFCFNSTVI